MKKGAKEPFLFKAIGHIESLFTGKFAVPRQAGLLSFNPASLCFDRKDFSSEWFLGIEQFSHLWVLWCFDQLDGREAKAKVRPPRLGGNEKLGCFATRSPYRPNPIGMSVVRFLEITENKKTIKLKVDGCDMQNGTAILDIKPYIPYCDSISSASASQFTGTIPRKEVLFVSSHDEEKLAKMYDQAFIVFVKEVLALDPRPAYANKQGKIYKSKLAGIDLAWRVDSGTVWIEGFLPIA